MSNGLEIRKEADLDFLSLGALVHRLDPGIIPFRKATECSDSRQRRRVQRRGQSLRLLRHEHRHRDRHGPTTPLAT